VALEPRIDLAMPAAARRRLTAASRSTVSGHIGDAATKRDEHPSYAGTQEDHPE
jgi:hypothetical protein